MRRLCEGLGIAVLLSGSALAQITQRISTATSGVQGDGGSWHPCISADGRVVAFAGWASSLVPGDTNAESDVFVRDRLTGVTTRVSVSSAGVQGNGGSYYPASSADGRFIAFQSDATNLVPGDTNGATDIFVHDRQTATTERVSISSNGTQGNGDCGHAAISADGRYVAFYSYASNHVAGDTNGVADVFVHDRQTGATTRVSVDSAGVQGNGFSTEPGISPDGNWVVFTSIATNLAPGEANFVTDIFMHDRTNGITTKVSIPIPGGIGDGNSSLACMSDDGRYVAFESDATDLVPGDTNGYTDIFVRDRVLGITTRVSISVFGEQGNGANHWPSISSDGRYVSFFGWASNLVPNDTNDVWDVFVHDRQDSLTSRVSLDSSGMQGNANSGGGSFSADSRFFVFSSWATNLIAGDTNATTDVFVRDFGTAGFTSLCDPSVAGVITCPCSNPPAATGHGCDNSSATGGASLSASGVAYVSLDRLVFRTNGETPSATSILMQGNAQNSVGVAFGQGVRCVAGALKRLFVKTASTGSISAPDFAAGDPSVSSRSAALGLPIAPGQSTYYLVYYRDTVVLGGCSASATFNATQTGRVTWWP